MRLTLLLQLLQVLLRSLPTPMLAHSCGDQTHVSIARSGKEQNNSVWYSGGCCTGRKKDWWVLHWQKKRPACEHEHGGMLHINSTHQVASVTGATWACPYAPY